MARQETPLVIIAGPTASGKSYAAAMLGRMLSGAVINADSMQVYADLRILTARPTPDDQSRVDHHLYGHIDGADRYSAGRFIRESIPMIEGLRAEGTIPILCGGTGLYLKALTEGLAPVPDVPDEFTARGEALWDKDPEGFRAQTIAHDPATERLDPADRQRHIRAWSVAEATGTPLSVWQQKPKSPPVEGPIVAAVLLPPRDVLYQQCDARFETMIEGGATDEVQRLVARRLPLGLPVMKALGVPELAAFLRGDISKTEAIDLAARETRRFAKRQTTWFRNQTDWPVFESAEELAESLANRLLATL
ncbi:MAG: tRNA (adenosine(37)-N6)-dimethylallyltransferase MiaA [Pseudomonadota bacterium]